MWKKWIVIFSTLVSCMQGDEVEVAVVGAGLAGLTAAYKLQQAGMAVKIFEAKTIPGGRVQTHYANGSFEELGGKFFDDEFEAMHLRKLVQDLGLSIESYPILQTLHYLKEGKPADFLELFENAPPPTEENYQSLKTAHFLTAIRRFLKDHPDLLRLMELRMANYEGTTAEKLDTHYLDQFWDYYKLYYEIARDHRTFQVAYVDGGNSKLIEALAQKLEGKIQYGTPVKELFMSPCGCDIGIEFGAGETEYFDAVIFAIPCTTLRDITFQDGMIPEDQLEAIQTLQYGTANKILLPVRLKTEPPSFAVGTEFISWVNEDRTFLTVYLGGKADPLHPQLEKHLPEIQALYPGLEVTGSPIIANWATDPYAKGSYSNFGLNQYEPFNQFDLIHGLEVKHLFRPINGKIFFAGEHTVKEFATMEGAVKSGDQAAELVLKALEK